MGRRGGGDENPQGVEEEGGQQICDEVGPNTGRGERGEDGWGELGGVGLQL